MSREEAIKYINTLYMALAVFPNQQISLGDIDKLKESVYLAIKVLEQESIIDKISADIEQVKSIVNEEIINHNRKELVNFVNGLNQSLMIIDKYKAESEDKE